MGTALDLVLDEGAPYLGISAIAINYLNELSRIPWVTWAVTLGR